MPRSPKPPIATSDGDGIALLRPTAALRPVVHGWMTASGIVERMMGPPEFPEIPVPSFEEFCDDWADHYWTHATPERGRMFLAAADGELVGCIAHNGVVILGAGERAVEIDLWLARPDLIGKGYGRRAIGAIGAILRAEGRAEVAFLQPSRRNEAACRCYAAAGFRPSPLTPVAAASHYRTAPDYEDSVFLVRRLAEPRPPPVSAAIQSR